MQNNEGKRVRVVKAEEETEMFDPAVDDGELSDVEGEPEPGPELEAAQREAAETYERLLRATAEFDNFKKRAQREVEGIRKFANETILSDLLSVVDNLERAIASAASEGSGEESIVQGVTMTLSELLRILDKNGVKPIESVGEAFDPTYHQAFMQEESDRHPDNTVISEIQKGYTMHDRLLRPAMVVVSKSTQDDDENGDRNAQESGL